MPEATDLELYASLLEQLRVRGELAAQLLSTRPTYPNVEGAALHMRIMLELIPLGALVAHREHVERVASAFGRKDPAEAERLVRRINPAYWPKPVVQVPTPDGPTRDRLDDVPDGFVTENEWRAEWGFLSSLLHARNPYTGEPELSAVHPRLVALHARLIRLLNLHWIELPERGVKLLGMIQGEDGRSHVNIFALVDSSEESCDDGMG